MRAALLLLLLVPAATANVVAIHADVDVPVDFSEAEVTAPAVTCRADGIATGADRIDFTDEATETDCALATVPVAIPAGASQFYLAFDADRRFGGGAPTTGEYAARQELSVKTAGINITIAVYEEDSGDSVMLRHRTPFFDAVGPASLSFFFADISGASIAVGSVGAGQEFAATVKDATLHFPNVAIPVPEPAPEMFIVIPREIHADTAQVRIRLDERAAFIGLEGAAGPIDIRPVDGVLVLDASILQEHGRSYRLAVETVAAPGSIAPLHWTPLIVVPLLGLVATGRSIQYRRGVRGIYRRTASYILAGSALTLVYTMILVAVVVLFLAGDMASLPLSPQGITTYVQFTVLALVFIAITTLASRSQLVAVQADLDRRQRQQEELMRSNRELEHFASVASHDLQEPLRKIAGFTNLLAEDPTAPKARQYAALANDGATRMQRMVQDLLRYSRLGQTEIDRLPVDLSELVKEVKADLAPLIAEHKATVRMKRLPTVHGAAGLLHQLLLNLIANGIKYRHPERRPIVSVTAHDWPFETQVVVADNGRGIPKGQEEKVFQLFRRVHDDQSGTGIGLALCARIVTLHGGRIWVESDETGSRFHFTIPRHT